MFRFKKNVEQKLSNGHRILTALSGHNIFEDTQGSVDGTRTLFLIDAEGRILHRFTVQEAEDLGMLWALEEVKVKSPGEQLLEALFEGRVIVPGPNEDAGPYWCSMHPRDKERYEKAAQIFTKKLTEE